MATASSVFELPAVTACVVALQSSLKSTFDETYVALENFGCVNTIFTEKNKISININHNDIENQKYDKDQEKTKLNISERKPDFFKMFVCAKKQMGYIKDARIFITLNL